MAECGENVAFLAIARVSDKAVLASCFDKAALAEEKQGFEGALAAVLQRAGSVHPGWKERVECRECDGVLHVLADAQALCVLVAGVRSRQYPERVASQLLRDLGDKARNCQGDDILAKAQAGALSTPLRKTMKDLMKSYNNVGAHDKTTEVRAKVDDLKGIMQDNVKKILETHVTLESLENNSSSMNAQANRFLRQSVDLRRQVQMRNLKLKMIVGLCATAVVVYIAQMFIEF
jgi:vesicle-associated membrane protein 7